MRNLKFRCWNGEEMISPDYIDREGNAHWKENSIPQMSKNIMQWTGLNDKNGKQLQEVNEDDIIDAEGRVIGNKYQNYELLQDPANLLIQGFGTATWLATYKEAVERGCTDA